MPSLREGDFPVKTSVEAVQHFTQAPPRYSEASLVKRLEELGIGRPSTYASILQTLKDREYVRSDKGRFVPEESGRLVTAFLERFFDRYVSYDYTAELEEELDDVSGGRLDWQKLLESFWRTFARRRPKSWIKSRAKSLRLSTSSSPRGFILLGTTVEIRGDARNAGMASSGFVRADLEPLSLAPTTPSAVTLRNSAQGGEQVQSDGPTELGNGISLKSGRFGPYVERGEGKEAERASVQKDVPLDSLTTDVAQRLAFASTRHWFASRNRQTDHGLDWRYGPYLAHDGKYAKLGSTAEVFETGMNAAVAKLADAASGSDRRQGASREPIAVLGANPKSGGEVRIMAGRYGPYATDGTTNATLPKGTDPKDVGLDDAIRLIDERASKGPPKKGGRAKRKKSK